ncbi:glycosyltransferase [Crocosphaera sp.]|uniref:glycosyltransferase n=1 Tax=Crocosphaera sp. TaxID=2729996 RepID=UPI00260EEBCD|nr:glycosyltransferase [Crocosphaera sp.]MDJ0581301.1 glycosyltransferase [Crocosphaera sp.]
MTNNNLSSKLIIFDVGTYGHHSSYFKYLLTYYYEQNLSQTLDIVVSPKFIKNHNDVVQLVNIYKLENVRFIPITEAEEDQLKIARENLGLDMIRFLGNNQNDTSYATLELKLFNHYAEKTQASQSMIMYLDDQRMLVASQMNFFCPFSGIYFTPRFHYKVDNNQFDAKIEKTNQLRQKMIIKRFLDHPQLHNLFCLDTFAVQEIKSKFKTDKISYLPDPVSKKYQEIDNKVLRKKYQISQEKVIFLLFGSLSERKGMNQLLKSILLLSDQECQQICLILAGKINNLETQNVELLQERINYVQDKKPIQLIQDNQFIPDAKLSEYFQLTDIVLITYPRHVGMSGVLLLASAYEKPVLASNYGLVGKLVNNHHLGITINATNPEEIANGIKNYLNNSKTINFETISAQQFSQEHSPEKFSNILLQN